MVNYTIIKMDSLYYNHLANAILSYIALWRDFPVDSSDFVSVKLVVKTNARMIDSVNI